MIERAKYAEGGSIIAVIDGQEMIVPDDMGNRHRVMLAEWESAGNVIEPYAEPVLTPEEQRALMPPISKRQLRLTLVRNGISLSDLDAAILAMGDEAVIEWQDASEYRRLHPLLNQVAAHLSLTQEQVDVMWQQALSA